MMGCMKGASSVNSLNFHWTSSSALTSLPGLGLLLALHTQSLWLGCGSSS